MHDAPDDRVEELIAHFGHPQASAAWTLCDRHPADAVAFTLVDADLTATRLTYGELRASSEKWAAALARLGVSPGDRVATLMGKSADLLTVLLGVWRLGAVYTPLFTALGPQAVLPRLAQTGTKVVVADPEQCAKLAPGPDMPAEEPSWRVVTADASGDAGAPPDGALSLSALLAAETTGYPAHQGGGAAPFVHMLTSGTTGRPKSVVHPFSHVAGWQVYLEYGLGVTADDAYWCAADPGWAYGLYSAIVGPMAAGARSHLVAGRFSPKTTWNALADLGITNFTAAPTVYRALPTADSRKATSVLRLRRLSSAGEPLTPEVNVWAGDALGTYVHDHYGQTELGMVLGNNHHPALARDIKPGSMGSPLPGWSLAVLNHDSDDPAPIGTPGRIAVDVSRSPLMTFRGYQDAENGGSRFSEDGRWYLTGDTGREDTEGYFHFSARDDDVMITAGYRISPFDVESVMLQHPAVAECAVLAVPDKARGEVIEAVVVTAPSYEPSETLAAQLQNLVKERYAAHAYPRKVRFANALPRTPSGKLQRYLLRASAR